MNDDMNMQEQVRQDRASQRAEDIRWLLDNERGRRVLFGMIDEAGTFSKTFTGNSQSYFLDGRRSIGLELFHETMELEPKRFLQMWNEHQAALADERRRIDEAQGEV